MGEMAGADSSGLPAGLGQALGGLYGGPLGYMALSPGSSTTAAPAAELPTPPADTPVPVPQFQPPAVDPALASQKQAADAATIQALMDQARGDTAALLARYGSKLAYGMA